MNSHGIYRVMHFDFATLSLSEVKLDSHNIDPSSYIVTGCSNKPPGAVIFLLKLKVMLTSFLILM